MHGPTGIFRANLTPFSLKGMPGVERLGRDAYLSKVRHDPAAGIRRAVMRHDLAAVRAALEAGADPNLEVRSACARLSLAGSSPLLEWPSRLSAPLAAVWSVRGRC
jgi:hypothetical protein